MARLEFNNNIIAGIKDKNNVYKHVSPGFAKLWKYPLPEKMRGLTEYQVAEYALQSPYCHSDEIADDLMIEDEQTFHNKQLLIFDSIIIHNKTVFLLVNKQPYFENNKITGSFFQAFLLSNMNKHIAKSYLLNPDISVAKHAKVNLDALGLVPYCKYKLGKRELECINFLVKGASARDIAHTLGLSKRTIDFYICNIKNKLNVRKTTEIITIALTDGITGSP